MEREPVAAQQGAPERDEGGWLPLEQYGALGDGRSVALIGLDGSIDWWCVPHMDSPPLFDKLLAPQTGGYFSITPNEPFVAERRYLPGSNVLETLFITHEGRARLTESLNSGPAGRLPWAELARRIEGIEGKVDFDIAIDFGTQADTVSPYVAPNDNACVFHAGRILGMFLHDHQVQIEREDDMGVRAVLSLAAGQRSVVAIIAGRDEPLVVPPLALIDERIDGSHREWCQWSKGLVYDGPHQTQVVRNALALKLLLSSPSGSIMAAATSSLPERIGGSKNYDYRFAWIRDAGYTIEAFLGIGAQPEAKAAFTWLLRRLDEHGPRVFYTLDGAIGDCVRPVDLPGYKNSPPVVGNDARDQLQHGVFGDIFETARCFIDSGNILDSPSATILSKLADQCADCWRQEDAGIWELPEKQHYTMSKISCWQALSRPSNWPMAVTFPPHAGNAGIASDSASSNGSRRTAGAKSVRHTCSIQAATDWTPRWHWPSGSVTPARNVYAARWKPLIMIWGPALSIIATPMHRKRKVASWHAHFGLSKPGPFWITRIAPKPPMQTLCKGCHTV